MTENVKRKEEILYKYNTLLYDWRESYLLIGPICLHKSLCAQTIPTQNQRKKNVCADLFCIVLYCNEMNMRRM